MSSERRVKLALLFLIIGLLSQDIVVAPNPVSTDTVLLVEEDAQKENLVKRNDSRNNICGNRGRFCEIICKSNPSEGGKMCK